MMNAVFALAADTMPFSDRASTAGVVTLQGMVTVFVVLAILWGAVEIMHRLLSKEKKEENVSEPQATNAAGMPNNNDAAVAAAIAAALAASEDDGATVAAITAAITAARAEEGNSAPFRVVSFKRATGANSRKRF